MGFYWNNGNFVSINEYVNGEAKPYGANNVGKIVGHYYPYEGLGGPCPGFLFDAGTGSVTVLTAPNAAPDSNESTTRPTGINDTSQVAGSWTDTSGVSHGFIYDAQQMASNGWTSFDHSGTQDTEVVGINGIGQVAGYYYTSKGTHGFVYSQADGFSDVSCKSASSTSLTGINNNGQVVGWCDSTPFIYDVAHGTMTTISGLPAYSHPWGVSDLNVPAGFCSAGAPCNSTLSDGFYATPNP